MSCRALVCGARAGCSGWGSPAAAGTWHRWAPPSPVPPGANHHHSSQIHPGSLWGVPGSGTIKLFLIRLPFLLQSTDPGLLQPLQPNDGIIQLHDAASVFLLLKAASTMALQSSSGGAEFAGREVLMINPAPVGTAALGLPPPRCRGWDSRGAGRV